MRVCWSWTVVGRLGPGVLGDTLTTSQKSHCTLARKLRHGDGRCSMRDLRGETRWCTRQGQASFDFFEAARVRCVSSVRLKGMERRQIWLCDDGELVLSAGSRCRASKLALAVPDWPAWHARPAGGARMGVLLVQHLLGLKRRDLFKTVVWTSESSA